MGDRVLRNARSGLAKSGLLNQLVQHHDVRKFSPILDGNPNSNSNENPNENSNKHSN